MWDDDCLDAERDPKIRHLIHMGAQIGRDILSEDDDGHVEWGEIVQVVLRGRQFKDKEFNVVQDLPLSRLWLVNTALTDKSAEKFHRFRSLTNLLIEGCGFTDAGFQQLDELQEMEFLTLRSCFNSTLGLTNGLVSWPQLRSLEVSDCPLSDGALKGIEHCRNLRSLTLKNTHITWEGLLGCEHLPNLTSVNFTGSPIGDRALPIFRSNVTINVLDVQRGPLESRYYSRRAAVETYLQSAWYQANLLSHGREFFDPVGEGLLIDLSHPQELDENAEVTEFGGQRTLRLGNNTMHILPPPNENHPMDVARRGLTIYFTRPEIAQFVTGLRMNNPQLDSSIIVQMPCMKDIDLQFLDVSGIALDERSASRISQIDTLRVLVLNGCQLNDQLLRHFESMPQLNKLSLVHNPGLSQEAMSRLQQISPQLEIAT